MSSKPYSRVKFFCTCGLTSVCCAVLLAGCGKETVAVKAPAPLSVKTVTAHTADAAHWVETLGLTEGFEQANVRAQVSGILQKIAYKEGDSVKRGQVLFELDDAPYRAALAQATAAVAQNKAQLAQAVREEARQQTLFASGATSALNRDNAVSQTQIYRAALASAVASQESARINLERCKVVSPVDGVVSRSVVNVGTLVTASSTELASVTQPDSLRIVFDISDRDIKGHAVTTANPVRIIGQDGKYITAKLDYVASQLSATTGTLSMRAIVPDDSGLIPGQWLTVQLQSHVEKGAVRVPQKAVVQLADGSYCVYIMKDGKAHRTEVKVGHWQDTDWVVTSGIKENDAVITDQIQRLADGRSVKKAEPRIQAPADTADTAATK